MENPTEPTLRRKDLRKAEQSNRKHRRNLATPTFDTLTAPVKALAGKARTTSFTKSLQSAEVASENIAFRGSNGEALRAMRRKRNFAVTAVTSVGLAGATLATVLMSGSAGSANSQVVTEAAGQQQVLAETVTSDIMYSDGEVNSGQSGNIAGGVKAAEGSDAKAASRSVVRTALPGCTGEVPRGEATNGQLPDEWLCNVGIGDHRLRQDAAIAFAEMNAAYKADTGKDMALTDTYRTLDAQIAVAASKPGLAAKAGTSMHGWGIAIDFGDGAAQGTGTLYNWLVENAEEYGWENPDWAKTSKYEPWHWEYVPARQDIKGR